MYSAIILCFLVNIPHHAFDRQCKIGTDDENLKGLNLHGANIYANAVLKFVGARCYKSSMIFVFFFLKLFLRIFFEDFFDPCYLIVMFNAV